MHALIADRALAADALPEPASWALFMVGFFPLAARRARLAAKRG